MKVDAMDENDSKECPECGVPEVLPFLDPSKVPHDQDSGWCRSCGTILIQGKATPPEVWKKLKESGVELRLDENREKGDKNV